MLHDTVICIASGSSLTQEDVDYCKDKAHVYVVNDCYKLALWADLLYGADFQWWRYHNGVPEFEGEKWTASHEVEAHYDVNRIDYKSGIVWSFDPSYIASGGNSGYQIMNLATLDGFDKIVLLGYDMQGKHWFGDHPVSIRSPSRYDQWIKNYEKASEIIPAKVINCSKNSALTCFEKADLRDVI